jgi:hypothetical protein
MLTDCSWRFITNIRTSIRGLNREDFQLFEDGMEQRIKHSSREDAAISVASLLDASSSMRDKMRQAVEAGGESRGLVTTKTSAGGKNFPLDGLPAICARIGADLREQYALGYSPTSTALDRQVSSRDELGEGRMVQETRSSGDCAGGSMR